MNESSINKLVRIGFSEYEAKAYVALLAKNPMTGYELAKVSGVPRSMIYEVMGKLTNRGAAMLLRTGNTKKYAPIAAAEFLEALHREQEELFQSLTDELESISNAPELDYVWNIEGHENIMAKAREMIDQAEGHIYLALLPEIFPPLRPSLETAVARGVRTVIYTTEQLQLEGGQVVVAHVSEQALNQAAGLGILLVVDGEEVLIGERLTAVQAWASWTRSPLFVFVAEHHLRTDLYLPQMMAMLGDEALDFIEEADRELFISALESHIGRTS